MQIVINISEKMYEDCKARNTLHYSMYDFSSMIANGTPLPKGHGDLKDATAVPQEDENIVVKSLLKPGTIACVGAIRLQEYINSLPAIIEADRESEDEE